MIIKWLGHASFLIKASGKNFYIDPYAGEYLEKADVILITHSHRDHCDSDKVKVVRRADTLIVTSPDCARELTGNVVSMSPGDKSEIHGVKVEAIEAYNYKRFRSPGVPFHPKGLGVGYLITLEGKTIYHAGDTDFIPEMKGLKNIDLALLPIGGTYTMDLEEAVEVAIAINSRMVIPIHRRNVNVEEFKKKVEVKSSVKVLAIVEGDEVDL